MFSIAQDKVLRGRLSQEALKVSESLFGKSRVQLWMQALDSARWSDVLASSWAAPAGIDFKLDRLVLIRPKLSHLARLVESIAEVALQRRQAPGSSRKYRRSEDRSFGGTVIDAFSLQS